MSKMGDQQLTEVTARTLGHYEKHAEDFWLGTRDHDVSQNLDALLAALPEGPQRILDLGCGPGRDLAELRRRGHVPVGLDGCARFVRMARRQSGAEVLHQDLLRLRLPPSSFDGIFANASLFHVPRQELDRVLSELRACLQPGGVLMSSNPRGDDREGYVGERYGVFYADDTWCERVRRAGFELVESFRRPSGRPPGEQAWLASVWRRPHADPLHGPGEAVPAAR